jgi:hypothetical protein
MCAVLCVYVCLCENLVLVCCRTASTQLANGGRNDTGCVCVCVCLGCVYVMATPHTDITHHHDSLHCKRKRRTDGGSAHFYKRRTSHKYTIDTHTHTRLLRLLAFLSFRQKILVGLDCILKIWSSWVSPHRLNQSRNTLAQSKEQNHLFYMHQYLFFLPPVS